MDNDKMIFLEKVGNNDVIYVKNNDDVIYILNLRNFIRETLILEKM